MNKKSILTIKIIPLVICMFLVVYQNGWAGREMSIGEINKSSIDVSLFDLLLNPDKYHGVQIRVIGVLRYEFEEKAIYLCKDHYQFHINRNAFWISVLPSLNDRLKEIKDLDGKYVAIEGVFNKKQLGHKGGFIGTIEKINRFFNYEKLIKKHTS